VNASKARVNMCTFSKIGDLQQEVSDLYLYHNELSCLICNIKLRDFGRAARQLGSSAGILSSAFYLREQLSRISGLYTANSATLFPRLVTQDPVETSEPKDVKSDLSRTKRTSRHVFKAKIPARFAMPIETPHVGLEQFPKQFELLADDAATFLECLNEVFGFDDGPVNASITSFVSDLQVIIIFLFVVYLLAKDLLIGSIGLLVLRNTRVCFV